MKNIIKIMIVALATITFAGCDDITTDGVTRITYYPKLTLLGDNPLLLNKGETFTDPGANGIMNGEDITSQIVTSGSVNTNVSGFYSIAYSAVNADGFSATVTRKVAVVDPNSFASAYFGESKISNNAARHYFDAPINITDNGNGTYTIDDLVGGFQFWGLNPGFEPNYDFHLETIVRLNGNAVEAVSYGSWYWGATGKDLQAGTYDSVTGTVSLTVGYGANIITVTLTKALYGN
jgi:hypothetical protein